MKTVLLACLLILSGLAFADANNADSLIPTYEKDFIGKIYGADKSQIVAQFGQPSKTEDIKAEDDKIIASIWHYHNINTDDKGQYYQTTELDFQEDKVVMVVFMNNDGSTTTHIK